MPYINETEQTVTATKDELNSLIEQAVDKKIDKALDTRQSEKPILDRTYLKALQGETPLGKERAKIEKTFRFFQAIAENDRNELRQIMSTYEPEYVRTLAPQVEGTSSAGGYLVPPEFYRDVIFLLNEYGFARKYCAQIQMRTNVLDRKSVV